MTTDGFHIKQLELSDSKQSLWNISVNSYQQQNQKDDQCSN